MKTVFALLSVVCLGIYIAGTSAEPARPVYRPTPAATAAPSGGGALLPLLGVSALAGAGLAVGSAVATVGLGLTPVVLTLGKKKRSLRNDAFLESLKYFDLAMELDSEFCLPLVLCEAASKQNKKSTKLQKAASKTARAG